MKKAAEQSASLEQRVKALDDMQQDVSKQRAETELLQMHPDFDEIRNDDDFHLGLGSYLNMHHAIQPYL